MTNQQKIDFLYARIKFLTENMNFMSIDHVLDRLAYLTVVAHRLEEFDKQGVNEAGLLAKYVLFNKGLSWSLKLGYTEDDWRNRILLAAVGLL
jgi:hypothetical protein